MTHLTLRLVHNETPLGCQPQDFAFLFRHLDDTADPLRDHMQEVTIESEGMADLMGNPLAPGPVESKDMDLRPLWSAIFEHREHCNHPPGCVT